MLFRSNLFYASIVKVLAFSFAGRLVTTLSLTRGAAQGCSSGPWFFHCSILPLNYNFQHCVLNVADDIYLVSPSVEDVRNVVSFLATVDLSINDKSAVVSRRGCPLAIELCNTFPVLRKSLPSAHKPFPCLGTIIVPGGKLEVVDISPSVEHCIRSIRARLDFITDMDASLQIKFLCLRDLQLYAVYAISAISHFLCDHLCDSLERVFATVFTHLFRTELGDQDRKSTRLNSSH